MKGSNLGQELLVSVMGTLQAGFNFCCWRSCISNVISKQTFCIWTTWRGHPMFSSNTSVLCSSQNHLALQLPMIKQKKQLLANKAVDLFWKAWYAKLLSFRRKLPSYVWTWNCDSCMIWQDWRVLFFFFFSLQGF